MVKGYIEFTEYSGIQNYGLYIDDKFIILNVHHQELNEEVEIELQRKLDTIKIYPISVRCSAGINIDEKYNPKKDSI